jgi:hypothetical protein
VEADFNPTTDVLTTASDGTLTFSGLSGDTFVFTAKGAGTDVHLQSGAGATLAASAHDITNFVGDEHRVLSGERFTLSAHGFGSGLTLHADPLLMASSGHGFSSDPFTDHGIAHASVVLR